MQCTNLISVERLNGNPGSSTTHICYKERPRYSDESKVWRIFCLHNVQFMCVSHKMNGKDIMWDPLGETGDQNTE